MPRALPSIILLLSCILIAGCLSPGSQLPESTIVQTAIATQTPAPTAAHCYYDSATGRCLAEPAVTTIPPVTTPAAQTLGSVTATATPTPALDTATAMNQISHRYTNTSGSFRSSGWSGSEIRFYNDGTVVYTTGEMEEVSSNIAVKTVASTYSGTFTALPGDRYVVKLYNVSASQTQSAPNVYDVRWYPEAGDASYPGLVHPERVLLRATGTTGDLLLVRAKSD
jgi:hypothetical protein